MNRIGRRSSGAGLSPGTRPRNACARTSRGSSRENKRLGAHDGAVCAMSGSAHYWPSRRSGARCSADSESGFTGDGDLQGSANLTHPLVAESAEALDERPQRHALDRVEVDDRGQWNGVLARLEQHLTRDTTDPRRAGSDHRASKARNRDVSREHHDRPAPDTGKLTPPDLSSRRKRRHDAPAAVRNEARSPICRPRRLGRGRTRRASPPDRPPNGTWPSVRPA
jgi:hypothetical protein